MLLYSLSAPSLKARIDRVLSSSFNQLFLPFSNSLATRTPKCGKPLDGSYQKFVSSTLSHWCLSYQVLLKDSWLDFRISRALLIKFAIA